MHPLEGEFLQLLRATSPGDVERVIEALGARIDWNPLGRNPENFGVIAMGSDPFDGVVERLTNAMDAMVEMQVELTPALRSCSTPRDAVAAILAIPGGNLRNCPDEKIRELANDIQIRFLDSDNPRRPTIEILDHGIGQHPSDFPSTLLSLNQGNKVTKFYLMGAFGHGGQTSFAQAEYGVIVSRRHPNLLRVGQADSVGWTIVRYHDPTTATEFHKQGRWEYCSLRGTPAVPSTVASAIPFALEHGTLIRLVSYDLPRGGSDVLQPTSTAWSFLSQALFDPILPIRLYEARARYETKNSPLSGLARRLWRGGRGDKSKVFVDGSYRLELGLAGFVNINYWALEPVDESDRWAEIRRTLVTPGHAVFFSLNGQRHDVETTTLLRDRANLEYASPYVIVQVDCDGLSKDSKKRLFPSTRQRLIEGELKETLLQEVLDHLKQDRNLIAFEESRMTKITAHKSSVDTAKIRRMVGQYVAQDPELKRLMRSDSQVSADGVKRPAKLAIVTPDETEEIRHDELESTALRETPSYLRITNSKDPMPIEKGGTALVRLETDANDSYFESAWGSRFRGFHLRGLTQRKSLSSLRRGKISYHVACPESVRVGALDSLRFELDLPDGGKLTAERDMKCIHPVERIQEEGRVRIPEPNIVGVTKKEHAGLWQTFSWDNKSVGRVYIGRGDAARSGIYVSLDNVHLSAVLRQRASERELSELIRNRYMAGVAFYLILRKAHELRGKAIISADGEGDSSSELDRLAQTLAAVSVPMDRSLVDSQ